MRRTITTGRQRLELDVPDDRLVPLPPPPENLLDPLHDLAGALEEPFHFPPLRQALTPEDQVAVVVDDTLDSVAVLVGVILDHITSAGVEPQAITLLTAGGTDDPPWRQYLPPLYRRVAVQPHDPSASRNLCYLATTQQGQRVYLNRTLVEADQAVVLSGRRYDPVLGYAGAESAIYPAFGDAETRQQKVRIRPLPPAEEPPPLVATAREVAWLLGAPFFVQVIEGSGDGEAGFVAGTHEAAAEGRRRQDARWRLSVPRAADLVVATLPGDPERQSFADLATALSRAARVVATGGAIALLTEAAPEAGAVGEFLRDCDDAEEALRRLGKHPEAELLPAWHWATAATQARLFVLSPYPDDEVERLFATPLDDAAQVQRLADRAGGVLLLPDAHKALPVLED